MILFAIYNWMKTSNLIHYLTYCCLRGCIYPFSLLSYKSIHRLGAKLGPLAFMLLSKYRKRTLSNLALASDLHLINQEIPSLAKQSLGSLLTTCLEYGKLSKEKNIKRIVECVNPSKAEEILSTGQGLIFLCAHQANWELFFLEGTSRMSGVAIGQPIKNTYLYNWVLKMRQQFGGKIVLPHQAVKEGLRALKQGKFLGIVGDQGMPGSGFCSLFLGRKAWTSPLPALLSYRSGSPIITATMTRSNGKYFIHYSDPIWPDKSKSMEEEMPTLMAKALSYLEDSIKKVPSEWLWAHNKWKQQLLGKVKKAYRQDSIAIVLPKDLATWTIFSKELNTFREIYPTEFLTIFSPFPLIASLDVEERLYKEYEEIKVCDYRFKLLFNLTEEKSLSTYFYHLSAVKVADLKTLSRESHLSVNDSLSNLLKGAVLNAI